MGNFKGTPGKWRFSNEAGYAIARNYEGELIEYSEYESNALLISKAPEMLEMLEELKTTWGLPNKLNDRIAKLIKEATEL